LYGEYQPRTWGAGQSGEAARGGGAEGRSTGAVAAPALAKDDAEADRVVGPPVGGVEAAVTEEGEELVDGLAG